MYDAVIGLISEGEDMNDIKVSRITEKAGIGKGTAYDYFDSKEEIIACAIAFVVKKTTEELHDGLKQLNSFSDRMSYLLDKTEEKLGEQMCFMRFVHMMSDTSALSLLLREKIEQESLERYLPLSTLAEVLAEAVEKGEVRDDLPMDYMVFTICSRLVTYMGCISTQSCTGADPVRMRKYVFQGMIEEFKRNTPESQ